MTHMCALRFGSNFSLSLSQEHKLCLRHLHMPLVTWPMASWDRATKILRCLWGAKDPTSKQGHSGLVSTLKCKLSPIILNNKTSIESIRLKLPMKHHEVIHKNSSAWALNCCYIICNAVVWGWWAQTRFLFMWHILKDVLKMQDKFFLFLMHHKH